MASYRPGLEEFWVETDLPSSELDLAEPEIEFPTIIFEYANGKLVEKIIQFT